MAKNILYDGSGQPIHSGDGGAEDSLPPGVQALIESRVNSALDNLRELNRADLKELARDHTRKWRWLAIISSVVTLVTLFIAPGRVIHWIGNQVDDKLTVPIIQNSADRLIKDKMTEFVSDRLKPLDQRAGELKTSIDTMNAAITNKQAAIEDQQGKLASQLHIQELGIAAKAGSRQAYDDLLGMRGKETNASNLLAASLKEIELFYDADRNQLAYVRLVKPETLADPGYAVDEAIFILRRDPKVREAAVNTLSKLKSKGSLKELCQLVASTKDLRVGARATRAIEEITGERIRPLEFENVQAWWNDNQGNPAYCADYDGYCRVVDQMWAGPVRGDALPGFIADLSRTIDTEPGALHSKCLKAGFLMMQGDMENAENLLSEVRKSRSDYYWLSVWDGALKVKQGDLRGAVVSVSSAFKKSPTSDVEATVRRWAIFDPIKNDPNVSWPSNRHDK